MPKNEQYARRSHAERIFSQSENTPFWLCFWVLLSVWLLLWAGPLSAETSAETSAEELTGPEIWKQMRLQHGRQPFQGRKTVMVQRQDKIYRGEFQIDYQGPKDFQLTILSPSSLESVRYIVSQGLTRADFPDQKLSFYKGMPETNLFPAHILLDQLPDWKDSLEPWAYAYHRLEDEFVALTPCYVLEIHPRGAPRPRYRYWISKQGFQILRTIRSWEQYSQPGSTLEPYFESTFTLYQPGPVSLNPAPLPSGTQVDMQQTLGAGFKTYASPEAAASAEKLTIYQPTELPRGFALRQVQVLRIFSASFQILTYSDGLNLFGVAIQPEIDLLQLIASGLVNLNYFTIVQRMGELDSHSPYNFERRFSPRHQIVVFGDLPPDELMRVSKSIAVP